MNTDDVHAALRMGLTCDDDALPLYGSLLELCWQTSAVNFGLDLAEGGMRPGHLREMASRWRDWDFEPAQFTEVLDLFADELERVGVAPRS